MKPVVIVRCKSMEYRFTCSTLTFEIQFPPSSLCKPVKAAIPPSSPVSGNLVFGGAKMTSTNLKKRKTKKVKR